MSIVINGPVNTQTSYGITVSNLINSLSNNGENVYTVPIGGMNWFSVQENIPKSLKNGESITRELRKKGKSVRIFHQFALMEHVCDYHIGFPIFELDTFTEQEIANLKVCDELIVCSKWAEQVILDNGITDINISVVPLGVDGDIFSPENLIEEVDEKEKPFTFFFPGKFEYRKGFDIVMEVFDKAFPTENVNIIFLPLNPMLNQEETTEWVNSLVASNLAKRGCVQISGRVDTPHEVANIVRYSDAVVSFSRAEGWNLPLLEALSCGRSVIATNYSGHTEFLNNENSTLVEVGQKEDAYDGKVFVGQGQWLSYTDSNIDDFVEALRLVYKNGRKYNVKGIETASQFSWKNSALKLASIVKEN